MPYVYLLVSTKGNTYIGATVDLNRRLRQHNKEIVGGAKRTGKKVAQGQSWTRVLHVSGFPSWSAALQFEWRWQRLSRKTQSVPNTFLERSKKALNDLLLMERSTSKAIPFREWPTPPQVHYETVAVVLEDDVFADVVVHEEVASSHCKV